MRESFMKRLFSKVDCGVCGKRYEVANVKVLDHEDGVWFLSVFCRSCGTQGLIAAVVKESSEVNSDLTESEFDIFARSEVVSTDDVLDIHVFLNGFDGDFKALFSNR